MNEWRRSTWGDEISLEYGKSLRNYSDIAGGFRVFGTNGPIGWTDKPLAGGPGVILGRKGAYRGVRYSPDPFFVIDTAYYVVPKTNLDMRWLYYAIIHHQLGQIDDGSPIPSTTRAAVYPRELIVPKPEEQRAIAGVLGALDNKIEHNRRTARALEELARSIFRAWFVDFEPVKAKVAGAVSFPSMSQVVFDALPTQFVESEIGLAPAGWKVKSVGECIQLTMGQSPPSKFYNESGEGLPFHQGVRDYGFRFPTHRVYCTVEGRIAEPDDVLLSVRAPVGRINVADRRLVLGRGLAGLRHRSKHQSFLRQQICHVFAEEDSIGEGTIYKAVTKRFLEQMPLLLPSEQAQGAFESLARPLDALIAMCEMESQKLAETRDLLLPKLLSGKTRVEVANG